jgi:hypothetical protein
MKEQVFFVILVKDLHFSALPLVALVTYFALLLIHNHLLFYKPLLLITLYSIHNILIAVAVVVVSIED